jgi:hypothetical protein
LMSYEVVLLLVYDDSHYLPIRPFVEEEPMQDENDRGGGCAGRDQSTEAMSDLVLYCS